MEKNIFQVVVEFLKKLPLWLRIVVLAAIAVAAAVFLQSCSNTKAVVRASAESTQASVTITTNNPTTVHVTNNQDTVGLNFNPRKYVYMYKSRDGYNSGVDRATARATELLCCVLTPSLVPLVTKPRTLFDAFLNSSEISIFDALPMVTHSKPFMSVI